MPDSGPAQKTDRPDRRRHPVWLYMVPVAVPGVLMLIYLISPRFYLDYILYTRHRETQVVEIVTVGAALAAGALLLWQGWVLARRQKGPLRGRGRGRGGAAIIGLIGLATLFFAGEEMSWGQSYFRWETPEPYRELSGETNLHNTDLPVNSLGSVFLVVMFFVLPLMWTLRWPRPLPGSLPGWRPAIAEAPVIFCMACGFAWKEVKTLYRWVNPDFEDIQIYHDFFEQLNEHKELLVAVALLMYAVYRIKAVRADSVGATAL